MKDWFDRTYEERHLLNPAFCSLVIWHAARGATEGAIDPRISLSFLETFLILPIVLHRQSRESLPLRMNSSMPVWIDLQPIIITNLPFRARSLVPYTKEALTFGGRSKLFEINDSAILINHAVKRSIARTLRQTSDEVRTCTKKAEFLGKWFAHTGTPETVFTLLGIRP